MKNHVKIWQASYNFQLLGAKRGVNDRNWRYCSNEFYNQFGMAYNLTHDYKTKKIPL